MECAVHLELRILYEIHLLSKIYKDKYWYTIIFFCPKSNGLYYYNQQIPPF